MRSGRRWLPLTVRRWRRLLTLTAACASIRTGPTRPCVFRVRQLEELFTADTSYDWGMEPGSGLEITGSFADVVLPRLTRDLLPAGELGCNEIIHGGTPGLVIIPDVYEGINFFSFYRPDKEGSATYPLDWGTWVVGVEEWAGRYVISYLVHYRWEI